MSKDKIIAGAKRSDGARSGCHSGIHVIKTGGLEPRRREDMKAAIKEMVPLLGELK